MGRKKLWVIGGAVASCPMILIASFLIANKFYLRFIFKGEMSNFSPGDSFGVILYTFLFTFLLFNSGSSGMVVALSPYVGLAAFHSLIAL